MPQRRYGYIIGRMGADDDSQPLVNDPAREAAASMRGYWTQVWRSVLAWMNLGETERLYLEGAEDIDRINSLAAETIQVKDVAANITLRSGDVIEAINNAWAHQQRNPNRTIQFRFLTTSGIGVEQGAPFGNGIGGLRFWRNCRSSTDSAQRDLDARAIADFLLVERKVSAAVQAFLQTASDADIWQRLIAPIEWDTDAEEAPHVIQEIKDRLVLLGDASGVTPAKAEEVAEHLYSIAYETATRQNDRYLTRAELLRVFHARTHLSLPAATVNALLAAVPRHLVPAGAGHVAVGGKSGAVGRPPRVPSRYYARSAVLAEIARRLSAYPVLVLQGGTGVGKSVAASGHAAASTTSWGWVDLRGLPPQALVDTLDRVIAELEAEVGLAHVVFDDIELPPDTRPLETRLARIKTILSDRSGQLVITSATALSQRLSLALALPLSGTMQIPAFTRDEIRDFLVAQGCPAPQVADWWAAFVELHTSGHAQLVHARVATLEAQGFPTPDMQSLTATPSEVVEARAEARRLITVLDAGTRELIYRLSLTVQALSYRQVLAITGQPPAIPEPGLAFDKLVGPWLELASEGHYRVSPLLRGVGADVQGDAWATAMHSGIASALLGFRTLSPTDVSTILFHATAGQNWRAVARLSFGLLKSDNEIWEALAESAKWFSLVGTGTAAHPQTDQFSLFLIRLLQLRLAAAARDDEAAVSVISCTDQELPANAEGLPLRLARHLFLAQVLMRTEVNLPLARLVSIGLEYIHLCDELRNVLGDVGDRKSDPAMAGPDGVPDLANLAGFTLIAHLIDRHRLAALVDACIVMKPSEIRRLLWFFGRRESISQFVFDRIWLAEFENGAPDWPACREAIHRAYALAIWCELPGLAQGAARVIARITDENLNNAEEALRLLDAMAAEVGRSPGLDDQRASILLRKGDVQDALTIWRELLPRWKQTDEFDLQQPFSCRLAAIAAARLDEWAEAAGWLRKAWELAEEDPVTFRAGLLIDEGYAHWKAGNNSAALKLLVDGLIVIEQLPYNEVDEKAYLLRKYTSHTMMWMANAAAGRSPKRFSAPSPAWCSMPAPFKDKLPVSPIDAMWRDVVEFEFVAGLGDQQFRTHETRLKASRYGPIRLTFNILRLQQRMRDLALDDFVEVAADYAGSFALSRLYYYENGLKGEDPLPENAEEIDRNQLDAEIVLSGLLNAVFALAARGAVTKEVLQQWAASATRAGVSAIVAPWLDFVEALFIGNTLDAGKAVRERSLPWPWQIVASIRLAMESTTRPAELLAIHDLWANVLPKAGAGLFVLGDIEHLVTGAWRRMAEERSQLRAPDVTAPVLLQACTSASKGWRKIGEVLIAAVDAVSDSVSEDFRERAQGLWKHDRD